jgi:hypothetical protein
VWKTTSAAPTAEAADTRPLHIAQAIPRERTTQGPIGLIYPGHSSSESGHLVAAIA